MKRKFGGMEKNAYFCHQNLETKLKATTMNRLQGILTTALLAVVLMTSAGCSKDSKEEMATFTIDTESISLLVNDDYKVTPSGTFIARSTDEDVATVNAEGVIHGVSAGEAEVIFASAEGGQTQTCKVDVDWRYKYFEEPVIAFGATKDEIKERETHEIIRERDNYIVYDYPGEEIMTSVAYTFDASGSLYMIGVSVSNQERRRSWVDGFLQQLTERYGNYSEVNGSKIFISQKGRYKVALNQLTVMYTPDTE